MGQGGEPGSEASGSTLTRMFVSHQTAAADMGRAGGGAKRAGRRIGSAGPSSRCCAREIPASDIPASDHSGQVRESKTRNRNLLIIGRFGPKQ